MSVWFFEEWERERGTYEEKPFREEAFGLREVGRQEGGHGGFVFLEVVLWEMVFYSFIRLGGVGLCETCRRVPTF